MECTSYQNDDSPYHGNVMCFAILFDIGDAWSLYLMAFVFTVVGLWVIWQPQGLLSSMKLLNKGFDPDDPEQQRFARWVGGGLIFFAVVLFLGLVTSR